MRLFVIGATFVAITAALASSGPAAHVSAATSKTNKPKEKTTKVIAVKHGDTLASIAKTNHTSYVRIYDANNVIKDPNLIYPAQKLRIPAPGEKLPNRPLIGASPAASSSTAANSSVGQAATTPSSAPNYAIAAPVVHAGNASVWNRIAACESGGNWATDTGNGYYGGLQFTVDSWLSVGGQGLPSQASASEQIARAQILESRQGWGAWPVCSSQAGVS